MKALFLIVFLPIAALAGGPLNGFPDIQNLNSEMDNIYHDIANPVINYGKASSMTVTNLTVTNLSGVTLGKIRQIVIASTTTGFTTTSATFQTTNSSATITPTSSSSRILIMASTLFQDNNPSATAYATIARSGSALSASRGFSKLLVTSYTNAVQVPATLVYLDSPATTSATTYSVQIRNDDGATTIGWGAGTTTDTQVMILAEVGP